MSDTMRRQNRMTKTQTLAAEESRARLAEARQRAGWVEVTEYRLTRNFIRPGDIVKVKPVSGRSFEAKVRHIFERPGEVEIEVFGGYPPAIRTVSPSRITRTTKKAS